MSTEASGLRPNPSSFPRPQSLHLPESSSSQSIISATSYSPFPAFPGARDPHGLDQFLLHPGDPSWEYTDPIPASSEPVAETEASSLSKRHSLIMLRRPSPLSQPPVSADVPLSVDIPSGQRRRSNTIDTGSPTERSPQLTLAELPPVKPVFADFEPSSSSMTGSGSGSSGAGSTKGSLRRALTFRGRSFLGKDTLSPETLTPPPSTPRLSARSESSYSEVSSASSTSSGEEVKTPNEAVLISSQVELAGGKLAEALAAESEGLGRRKTWRGWLSGKRLAKLPAAMSSKSSLVSGESSPASTTSPLPPRSSSPAITSIVGSEPISRSASEKSFQDVIASEQLRRLSIAKLAQLRSPSPHPLALSLKRQYCNLPDEIACSIQSGQKVFPLSVNVVDPSAPLSPGQGGLTTSLAIKSVLQKLEQGHTPPTPPRRTNPKRSILPRPRGVLDFISRPTFEERNIVFYPNGTFSPISMARPGYGVWDLDFSAYILALSQVDELPDEGWPIIPRASIGASIDELEAVMSGVGDSSVTSEEEIDGIKTSRDRAALLPGITFTLSASSSSSSVSAEASTPIATSASTADLPSAAVPESSFRRIGKVLTWDESSESSDDEGESEDEKPLRAIQHRRSFPAQLSTTSSRSSLSVPDQPRSRASSQPGREGDRAAFRKSMHSVRRYVASPSHSSASPRTRTRSMEVTSSAMDAVAQARERRQANLAGEGERRAEVDRRRKESEARRQRDGSKPTSTKSLPTSAGPPVGSSSTYSSSSGSRQHARLPSVQIQPASPLPHGQPLSKSAQLRPRAQADQRRPEQTRSRSYYDSLPRRPANHRQNSNPGSPGSPTGSLDGKRYNSFYGALPTQPHSMGYGPRHHASLPPHLAQYPQPWLQMPHPMASTAQMGPMPVGAMPMGMYEMGYQPRGLSVPQSLSRRRHVN